MEKRQQKKLISLTLAFEPSSDFLAYLKDWLWANYSKEAVLDLKIDPKICGGAIVVANDHWRDYSLAFEVDKLLKSLK